MERNLQTNTGSCRSQLSQFKFTYKQILWVLGESELNFMV